MERYKLKVAVYIILVKDDQVLLGRRLGTGWQDGNYGLPAGHLEPNETLAQGAVREMEEETGIVVKEEDLKFVHVMHRMGKYMDMLFEAKNFTGEAKIGEPDKCDDLSWFPLNDLPQNIIPSIKHVLGQYLNNIPFSEFNQEE